MESVADLAHSPAAAETKVPLILDVLSRFLVQADDKPTLLHFMLCSKVIYARTSKALYKDIRITEKNSKKIFRGLTPSLLGCEDVPTKDVPSLVPDTGFALDPLAVHRRKLGLLNSVDHLTFADYHAVLAVAKALDPSYDQRLREIQAVESGQRDEEPLEIPEMPRDCRPFARVTKVTFEPNLTAECQNRLNSNIFYKHRVVETLVTLNTLTDLLNPHRQDQPFHLEMLHSSSPNPHISSSDSEAKGLLLAAVLFVVVVPLFALWLLFRYILIPIWSISKGTCDALLSFLFKIF